MRNWTFLLLLPGLTLQTLAAKHVTVAQLEQTLTVADGKHDAAVAKRLSEFELTERLSDVRLVRLKAKLAGPLAQPALVVIADSSAFLNLPSVDIPAGPAPSSAAQGAQLAMVFDYARKTIPKLPNFCATRETTHFEDTPSIPHSDPREFSISQPLHFVGLSRETVLYRNGSEIVDAGAGKNNRDDPLGFGLSTSGAFGPILATVLADSSQGKLVWSHWEHAQEGMRAVYRFEVPEQASHYTVTSPGAESASQLVPAYHGEMGIDPADGTVLRLTMVAELKPTDPVAEAGIMVEYGSVEIGGKTYMCPVKSVARSLVRTVRREPPPKPAGPAVVLDSGSTMGPREIQLKDEDASQGALQLRVNDVLFKDYHLFRAEVRVLNGDDAKPEPNPPSPVPSAEPSSASESSPNY